MYYIFKDSKLLVEEKTKLPFKTKKLPFIRELHFDTYSAASVLNTTEAPKNALWLDLKELIDILDPLEFEKAGKASQLLLWDRSTQFCGECGTKTFEKKNERAKECPSCHSLFYPKISPVVMALVYHGEKILLARGPHFPKEMMSVLAGFVDPGETLEQCIKREIFEEVGLLIDKIEYISSSAWPFPNSLLIGFKCRYLSGEISIDPSEIEFADWYSRDNLPKLPPQKSLSKILIDRFFAEITL